MKVERRVYVFGASSNMADTRAWIAYLAAGPTAVMTGASAAREWRFAHATDHGIELLVTTRQRPIAGADMIETTTLRREDWTIRNGRRFARPERAIIDLADRRTELQLCRYLREAGFRDVLDLERLRRTMDRNRGRIGAGRLRRALARFVDGHGGVDSGIEARVARRLRAAGVRDAIHNAIIRIEGESLRPDVLITDARLVAEVRHGSLHDLAPVVREDKLKHALLRSRAIEVFVFDAAHFERDMQRLLAQIALRRGCVVPIRHGELEPHVRSSHRG